MADENKIVVEYDTAEFKRSVLQIIQEQKKVEGSFTSSLKKMAIGFGSLYAAYKVATTGVKLFYNNIKMGVNESSAAQDALHSLNASLAQTGQLSIATSMDLQRFSQAMESTTRFAASAVQEQMSLSISMGMSAQQAKETQIAAANLASALKMDLGQATDMLNRRLGGTSGRLGLLIPQVKELTEEQLKNGEATRVINELFGGRAVQDVKTFSGALEQNKNVLGGLREQFGNLITQNPVVVKIINLTSKLFLQFANIIQENMPTAMKIFNRILIGAIQLTNTFVQTGVKGFLFLSRGVDDLVDSFASFVRNSISNVQIFLAEFGLFMTRMSGDLKIWGAQFGNDFVDTILSPINFVLEKLGKQKIDSIFDIEGIEEDVNKAVQVAEEGYRRIRDQQELMMEGFRSAQEEKHALRDQERAENDALIESLTEAMDGYVDAVKESENEKSGAIQNATKTNEKEAYGFWKTLIRGTGDVQSEEDKAAKEKVDNFKATMGTISTLQKSGVRELAMIGKAASISMATIDGIAAVQKALSAAPPPFNFVLAGLVGTATAANIAEIASTPIGFATGGVIGGPSTQGDNLLIAANAKERVLTAEQNRSFESLAYNNNNLIPELLQDLISVTQEGKIVETLLNGRVLNDELEQIKNRML